MPIVAILLQFMGASPVTATTCERISPNCEFDAEATVSVSNFNVVCTPPSPITQGIQLNGDFVIRAHIVVPPSPVLPPSPVIPAGTIVSLHLDATSISGLGLTDDILPSKSLRY